jgi:hypothetical protein
MKALLIVKKQNLLSCRSNANRHLCFLQRLYWMSIVVLMLASSCSSGSGEKDEQIRAQPPATETDPADTANSISGKLSSGQVATAPRNVVLTGLQQHRLVTVYKEDKAAGRSYGYNDYYDDYNSEREIHFMPGIDLIHGYNLLNIAHYDMTTEKLDHLFDHPVLVKSVYYPSFIQDSLYEKPVNRNYYLVSVYDTDTNMDTLINKRDLRRFYHFNAACTEKTQLIPHDYSVERSQYDPRNDVMFVFARHDADHNGVADKKEPLHIFWLSLKTPGQTKRLY